MPTNPGSSLAGHIGGGVVQAAATLGASAPETFLGRLGMNVLGGASQGATYGALSTDGDIGDRLGGAAEGAGWGTAFGLAPSILEGGYKTLRGGVQAALFSRRLGLIDNWLRHVQDVAQKHGPRLALLPDEESRAAVTAMWAAWNNRTP